MQLLIRHRTVYRYESEMRYAVQSLRLSPATSKSQRVIRWNVASPGGRLGTGFTDGAGDLVRTLSHAGPVSEVIVDVEGEVETADTAGVLKGHAEHIQPAVYLRDTAATKVSRGLSELAASVTAAKGDNLDLAHRLSEAVAAAVAYRAGATDAATTAAEALERGEGVCQDQAHVLMAIARCHDIPARYVSGYLFDPEPTQSPSQGEGQSQSQQQGEAKSGGAGRKGKPDKAATPPAADLKPQAGHAWAELYIPSLGWVGFDPTNGCCPDDRYVRLGSGLNALQAAPIRGVSLGPGRESMHVTVSVEAAAQQ